MLAESRERGVSRKNLEFFNVLPLGMNAVDIDYDILVCAHQDGTRVLADFR